MKKGMHHLLWWKFVEIWKIKNFTENLSESVAYYRVRGSKDEESKDGDKLQDSLKSSNGEKFTVNFFSILIGLLLRLHWDIK